MAPNLISKHAPAIRLRFYAAQSSTRISVHRRTNFKESLLIALANALAQGITLAAVQCGGRRLHWVFSSRSRPPLFFRTGNSRDQVVFFSWSSCGLHCITCLEFRGIFFSNIFNSLERPWVRPKWDVLESPLQSSHDFQQGEMQLLSFMSTV